MALYPGPGLPQHRARQACRRCDVEAAHSGITVAFEHMDRRLLLEEGAALGYPLSALMAALDMYAMKWRLVFRECVGPEMWARRGIGAGSAFSW